MLTFMADRWASVLEPTMTNNRLFLVLVAIAALAAPPPARAQLETRSNTQLSGEGFAAAVGDFNHDGAQDVAAITYLPVNGVTILLGLADRPDSIGHSELLM